MFPDNGACSHSTKLTRHPATTATSASPHKPHATGGKVERYNHVLAEELLYARPIDSKDACRDALETWNSHYNYLRPHAALGNQPPAAKVHHHVINVMASYTQGHQSYYYFNSWSMLISST